MNEMAISIAQFLVNAIKLYALAGVIFSVPFLLFGIQRIDPGAKWHSGFWGILDGIGFRILIIPGLCVFWPLFVVRLIRGKTTPEERNAHRILAKQS